MTFRQKIGCTFITITWLLFSLYFLDIPLLAIFMVTLVQSVTVSYGLFLLIKFKQWEEIK